MPRNSSNKKIKLPWWKTLGLRFGIVRGLAAVQPVQDTIIQPDTVFDETAYKAALESSGLLDFKP